MILKPSGVVKQRLTGSSVDIGTILGLENVLQATGLILTCPQCASEGFPQLETDNSPTAEEWKIDCQCRERRFLKSDTRGVFDSDGQLLATADQALKPLMLTVRCPEARCVRYPLHVERTPESTIIRCHCAKSTLRRPTQPPH